MKKLLLLTLALSLPLSQVTRADNTNQKKRRHPSQAAENQSAQAAGRPAPPGVRQPVGQPAQQVPRTVMSPAHRTATATRDAAMQTPSNRFNQVNTRNRNVDGGRTNSQVSTQRNGGNRNFNRNSFSVARTRVVRGRHDRGWWRNHFNTTFVLFGGGYYYYDLGYWYPAYGYSPIYNNYAYSEPIYGYNNLAPGQVLENVQLALRDQGYYRGPIDGLIGPETRAALAAYQQDQGLVVTSAVDEPTLVTLGLA